ncbi:hypothetical protein HL653_07255 [Sphingomonas sp. AP4-R1]|nr:hypothetical protein HL653_07255 [Sphingomonas sp. AP4-R1]
MKPIDGGAGFDSLFQWAWSAARLVVVTIADTTDRRLDPGFGEALGVLDRHVLRSKVAMMDKAAPMGRPAIVKRLFQSIKDETGCAVLLARQPTMRLA